MANESAAKSAGPAPDKDPLGPRIAVKALYLDKERELPGAFGSALNGGGGSPNQKRWFIDFLPRVGLYEIRYHEPSSTVVQVRLIPREWASYTPA